MERPWFFEDNKVDFTADGLKCCLHRGPLGAWCGYVGIPSIHPWFGKSYSATIKPTEDMLGPRHQNDFGAIEFMCAALSGKDIAEEMSISLAMRLLNANPLQHNWLRL